jgi:hypothetical protein
MLQKICKTFQGFPFYAGGSTQHGRDMESCARTARRTPMIPEDRGSNIRVEI